jgi:iron(III) transport system permease protein
LAALLRSASGDGWSGVSAALAAPGVTAAVLHTLTVGLAVTGLAVAAGAALAVHRGVFLHSGTVLVTMTLPLFVPEFVLAYSWSQAYGPAGLSHQVLGVAFPRLLGPWGIVMVLA